MGRWLGRYYNKRNCSGLQHLKIKDREYDCRSKQNILRHYQWVRTQFTSSIKSWETANFRVTWPKKAHRCLIISAQTLFKYFFSFHEFVSAWKNSTQFLNSFLTYSRFYSPRNNSKVMPTFGHYLLTIIKVTFILNSIHQTILEIQ